MFSLGYDFHLGNDTSGTDNGNVWGITNYKDSSRNQSFTYHALSTFEEPGRYRVRRIADRFTDDMLERYCKALGIAFFDGAFYGTKAAVVNTVQKLASGSPVMSLEDARSRTGRG